MKKQNQFQRFILFILTIICLGIYYYFFVLDQYDKKIFACEGLDQKLNTIGADFGCKMDVARELVKKDPKRSMEICLKASPLNDGTYYGKAVSTGFCRSELNI